MTKWTIAPLGLLAALLAGAPLIDAALATTSEPRGTITVYSDEGMQGAPVTITTDTANLQSVAAAEGFDGTANDYARSLVATGRWLVCMDAGYQTACREVDGEVANLGEDAGSISSLRYIGPSRNLAAAPAPRPSTSPSPRASGPSSQAAAAEDWQPMYNVDLYGNDIREIAYERPGSSWQTCRAACDENRQCQAWTYVEPGRTPYGECFLKAPVPEAAESECCISGVKGAPSSGGQTGGAAIELGLGRYGETARHAADDEVNNAIDRRVRGALGRLLGN